MLLLWCVVFEVGMCGVMGLCLMCGLLVGLLCSSSSGWACVWCVMCVGLGLCCVVSVCLFSCVWCVVA